MAVRRAKVAAVPPLALQDIHVSYQRSLRVEDLVSLLRLATKSGDAEQISEALGFAQAVPVHIAERAEFRTAIRGAVLTKKQYQPLVRLQKDKLTRLQDATAKASAALRTLQRPQAAAVPEPPTHNERDTGYNLRTSRWQVKKTACRDRGELGNHTSELRAGSEPIDATSGEAQLQTDVQMQGQQHRAAVVRLDPFDVLFTHGTISARFRNGNHIDDTIAAVSAGRLAPEVFPPLEAVRHSDGLFSLSNRRLFLFRVLAVQGKVNSVRVELFEPDSERVRQLKWDWRLHRFASKWDRAFSTQNGAQSVRVASAHVGWHFPESRP
eukprot:gnl/TRDRNA2_/TRDRNA2_31734_c0_seq1.p1 gnl/TRDRNA2_/TRDRNA2_31734_c0~~gnl/TRDRNA2_/TRDRNA2_31734_c0_seq1.p1  ORF type:complete len:324 (-),score=25.09 gnl/TRDRNA2_/TRDRNA2_31734_c0_seq1:10-981(-)